MFALPYNFVSYPDLMLSIRSNIARVPREIDLIVGIPRSGMIPAYALALYLNVQVSDLSSFLERRTPTHGRTRAPVRVSSDPFEARHVLLVDDSCLGGGTLEHARSAILAAGFDGEIVTCAAIVAPEAASRVDVWFAEIPLPRVFEWNVFHHSIIEDACVDLDGVLCVDPLGHENDDGPNYAAFMANVRPLHVPSRPIGHIVSARLEKYRSPSEEWLARHGIRYGQLHLLDLPSAAERVRMRAHHKHKSEVYRRVGARLFIESDDTQAAEIAQTTGRPVLCATNMKLYSGNGVYLRNIASYALRERRGAADVMRSVRRRCATLLQRMR